MMSGGSNRSKLCWCGVRRDADRGCAGYGGIRCEKEVREEFYRSSLQEKVVASPIQFWSIVWRARLKETLLETAVLCQKDSSVFEKAVEVEYLSSYQIFAKLTSRVLFEGDEEMLRFYSCFFKSFSCYSLAIFFHENTSTFLPGAQPPPPWHKNAASKPCQMVSQRFLQLCFWEPSKSQLRSLTKGQVMNDEFGANSQLNALFYITTPKEQKGAFQVRKRDYSLMP